MLTLAIGLAVAGACCFAGTVHLHHRAVRNAVSQVPQLRLSGIRAVLRTPGWYAGVGLAGLGATLHVLALTMAPLAVGQPIGVLTMVLTGATSPPRSTARCPATRPTGCRRSSTNTSPVVRLRRFGLLPHDRPHARIITSEDVCTVDAS